MVLGTFRADHMAMQKVHPIPAFSDNYIWCVIDESAQQALVVDPGDAKPVLTFLEENNLGLSAILVTHHHRDHTGGIASLRSRYGDARVYGPDSITDRTDTVGDGDKVRIEGFGDFVVTGVPGHTLDHVAYYQKGHLFCGDTLFSAGCGRLFEGTPAQMFASLQRLADYPDDTLVYPAHEYTLGNLRFAATVEPDNAEIATYRAWVEEQRALGKPSLPTTIQQEKAVNPFLRSHCVGLKHLGEARSSPLTIFTIAREKKDHFS